MTTARQTLPLSLVFVYVGIARRLGLEASAINTPGCVTALVHNTAVDVAHSHLHPILDAVDHEQIKHMFGSSYQTGLTYQLLLRTAANIEHGRVPIPIGGLGSLSPAEHFENEFYLTGIKTKYMGWVISCFCIYARGNASGALDILRSGHFPLDLELVIRDNWKLLTMAGPLSESGKIGEILSDSDIDEGFQSTLELNSSDFKHTSNGFYKMVPFISLIVARHAT